MKALLRPSLSTSLVAFFFLILLILGLFAEVFESRTNEVDLAQIYANPVPVAELQRLKQVRLTNKHGSFLLENTDPEGHLLGPWQMIEPQSLRAKEEVINKIVDALNVMRVRNFHRLEPINITSFSLDNPTLTLHFTTPQERSYEIKVGLINPIDNSAYLSLSSQDQIYQIDPLEMALESYDLPQLVENKIFALNMDSLASLEIYGQTKLIVKLLKKDEQWLDQNGVILSETKVKRFIERLEDLKSTGTLDSLSAEQKKVLDHTVSNADYTLKLIYNQGVRNYLFGEIKGNVPGLNIPAGSVALTSEERRSYVLLDRQQLRTFNVNLKDLK